VQLVALLDDQERVELSPLAIVLGDAVNVTAGTSTLSGFTVTVVD